jgi:hypothetical protein
VVAPRLRLAPTRAVPSARRSSRKPTFLQLVAFRFSGDGCWTRANATNASKVPFCFAEPRNFSGAQPDARFQFGSRRAGSRSAECGESAAELRARAIWLAVSDRRNWPGCH